MNADGPGMVEGAFPALEAAFLEQARGLRAKGTRLEPVAVLAPNDMLRRRLSRALAESGCAHANIHFLTVQNLAERLAGRRLALAGFSPGGRQGLELIVAMAAAAREMEAKLEYFRRAAQQEGFQRAMLETFRDLKEAGLRPRHVRQCAAQLFSARRSSEAAKRGEDLLRRKLADVALLWERVERAKEEHKLYDDADLLEAAAEEAAGSKWLGELAQFIIYGFYDLTGSQKRLLAACLSRAPTTAYFPYCEEEAWRYARPAREWFRAKCKVQSAKCKIQNAKCKVQNAAEVLMISAPGEAREAAEVVREILAPGPEGERIGILMRSDAPYMELLQETLESAHVNAYFPEGPALSRLPAGRALLDLAGLAGGRLHRAHVMDFVTSAPLNLAPFRTGAHSAEALAAEWNAVTIEAGIVEGRTEWETRLPNADGKLQNAEPNESLRAFRAFLKTLFDGLENIAGQKSWKGFAEALARVYRELIVPGEGTDAALEALDEISGLDAMGAAPTLEQFRALVRQAMEETCPPVGRFERNEPTVAKLMAARGVQFDVVVAPGLVEKSFPQPARQDPILLDAERAQINALLARAGVAEEKADVLIPLKGRRREEEELLFALAAQAARRRLVLTFPRLDAAKARLRTPSYFLLRQVEAATGKPADYAALDAFLKAGGNGANPPESGVPPLSSDSQKENGTNQAQNPPQPRAAGRITGRYVPMTLLNPAARDRAVSELEYDLASFGKAREEHTPNALLYLKQSGRPFFGRAFEAESERWGNESFTPYDGVVKSQDLLRTLGNRLHDDATPVSPTRLEEYATCPFSYLLRHVFGLEPVEEPERATTLSPLYRGSLVHNILWQFLSEAARDQVLPLRESHWPRLAAAAAARFDEFERRGVTGYPLMWRIEKARILEELREFLRLEGADPEPFRPAYFEVRFGMRPRDREESEISTEAPALLELKDRSPVRFCGKMDRVDVDAAGKRCRVVDYKTGANRLGLEPGSFHGGQALQLPIYLLGARRVLSQFEPDYAEYFYASDRGKWQRIRFTAQDLDEKKADLQLIVGTILDGIRAGRFFPLPEEADCDRCELRLACGHGRFLDFKWEADRGTTAEFRKMAELA